VEQHDNQVLGKKEMMKLNQKNNLKTTSLQLFELNQDQK
jgi:hypothetical protein